MTGTLKDLTIGLDGKQNLTVAIMDADFREQYDALKEKKVSIEIKQYRKGRSLDANAYAWVLIDQIAGAMGITKAEVYRKAIRSIGGVSEIVCTQDKAVDRLREVWESNGLGWQTDTLPSQITGCTNVILYYGSSVYDTKQMSNLIDSLIQEAESLGIPTMTPAELARLLEKYKPKTERKDTQNGNGKEEGMRQDHPDR